MHSHEQSRMHRHECTITNEETTEVSVAAKLVIIRNTCTPWITSKRILLRDCFVVISTWIVIYVAYLNYYFVSDSVSDKNSYSTTAMKIFTENTSAYEYFNYSVQANIVVNPINNIILISNEQICKNISVDIILIVPSHPRNVEKRVSIRNTFATLSRDRMSAINGVNVDAIVRTVFLLGKTLEENDVRLENEKYEDIVLFNFTDSYEALTTKILHGIKWVNEFCKNVSYVMKVDDDVFVNIALLSQRLKSYKSIDTGAVFGYLYKGYPRVARSGKWAVPYSAYPLSSYPEYMSGTSYIITSNLVPKILNTAERLPYVEVEDALITGIVANRIHSAKMVHWKDNSRWSIATPKPCHFVNGKLSSDNATPQLIMQIWNTLSNSTGTEPNKTICMQHRPQSTRKI